MKFRLVIYSALFLCVGGPVSSLAQDFVEFPADSVLSQTPKLPGRYARLGKLSEAEGWKLEAYGLRMAPLDPQVWSIRKVDLTENRRLVPMRKFYLTRSESPEFLTRSIKFQFRFRPVKERHMLMLWHSKDPIFDVGFSGKYQEGPLGKPAPLDTEYILRLSAFPGFDSGIYFRNGINHRLIAKGVEPKLSPGQVYDVAINFSKDRVSVLLDNQKFAEVEDPDAARGLISLFSGWHPVYIPNLIIDGVEEGESVKLSGLVSVKEGGEKADRK